ncbi:MAG: thiamine pyrophosphate-dependent dehydrogenase E1 component subunit alpha [Pseudomonadota bacterium]
MDTYAVNANPSLDPTLEQPTRDELLAMYGRMVLIRRVEERLGDDFTAGKLPQSVHLYVGQEACAVGVCARLEDGDWVASTHRGHGHYLARDGDVRGLFAEGFGRRDGICRGMGGSPHVADFSKGIIGANAVVGGGIGIATGAALAAQMQDRGRVAVCFFGDGAAAQGWLGEALNIAALWRLPLVLVCENNGFAEFMPTATVTAGSIASRAAGYGVPGVAVDGNDLIEVWQAAGPAVARARAGQGPTLLELRTYRTRAHTESESGFLSRPYRTVEEVEDWRTRDPLPRVRDRLSAAGVRDDELDTIDAEARRLAAEASAFAETNPWPDPSVVYGLMFHDQEP